MRKSWWLMPLLILTIGHGSIVMCGWMGFRLSANTEWIKLYRTHGGYRSWTVSYSDGRQWDGTRWINLWRMPRFHHADVRMYANER